MELLEGIYNRRTVRVFRADPISEEDLATILEAGIWAPSHANNQPWEFIIIGPETRTKLAVNYREGLEVGPLRNPNIPEERKQTMRKFAENFGDAPILLAVACPVATTDLERYDFPLSAAAAIQNISLAAWEKGIGNVWLSFGMRAPVQSLLEVEGSVAGILAMGYSDVVPKAQPRISVADKTRRLP